jgi:hypothetical protein
MTADPIWHPHPHASQPCLVFQASFALSAPLAEASLRCAGQCAFQVYLNGALVCRGVGPSMTPQPVWETAALADLAVLGPNTLRVLTYAEPGGPAPWFRAEGRLLLADGGVVELVTSPQWRCCADPAWERVGPAATGVCYLASVALGHGAIDPDAARWVHATAVPSAPAPHVWSPRLPAEAETFGRRLLTFGETAATGPLTWIDVPEPLADCKCVRREAVLHNGRHTALVHTRAAGRGVYLVLDFGRQVTGYPRLRLRRAAGGVIDLGFCRRPGSLETAWRYVAGNGPADWIGPRLEACRYLIVRLSAFDDEAELDCVSMVERRGVVLTQGTLEVDEWVARVWSVGLESVDVCRQEVYWLTPGAASYPWLAALPIFLNDTAVTGDTQTAAAMLASQTPVAVGPDDDPQAWGQPLLAEAHYRHSGDASCVDRLLPAMVEALLDSALPARDTAAAALALAAAEAVQRLCRGRVRGGPSRCEPWRRRAAATLRRAWDEDRGLYRDRIDEADAACSQWPNALVLYFGLGDAAQHARLCEQLRTADVRPVSGLLQAFFLAGGFWRAGDDRRALQTVAEHWGALAERDGATWSDKARRAGDFAAPGPDYLLASYLLGVRVPDHAVADLEIHPMPSGLTRATGSLMTAGGPVRVQWRVAANGDFSLGVQATGEGQLRLTLPRQDRRFPTVSLNGATVWRNDKVHPNAFVRQIADEPDRVVLVVPRAGEYQAEVS